MALPQPAPELPMSAERLPWSQMCVYSGPAIGFFLMVMLLLMYFFKYSTDILLLSPGIMGVIVGLSRLWDAVLDPSARRIPE